MTKILEETIQSLWPGDELAPPPPFMAGIDAGPGFRPPRSKWELKADETTRVAREITDAEADKRQAGIGRLRRARLEREAAERSLAALIPPKKKRRS